MRRVLWAVLGIALLVLVATVAAFVWRGPRLAEHAIRQAGAVLGYQDLDATVSRVGLGGMAIERLSAGPPPGFALEGIELGYGLRGLLAGRVATVRVRSAVLHGEWSEEAGAVFPALPASEGGPWLAPPAFDHLTLEQARIVLSGADGPLQATLSQVELGAPPGERLRAKLALDVERAGSRLLGEADLVLDGDTVSGHTQLRNTAETLELALDLGAPGPAPGRFPDVAGPEGLKLAGQLVLDARGADLSPLLPSLTASGTVRFRLADGHLHLASEALELATFGASAQGLELDVDLAGPASPDAGPPVGALHLTLAGARIAVDGEGGPLVARLSQVAVDAPAGERLRAQLSLALERDTLELQGEADLVLDDRTLSGGARLGNRDETLDLTFDLGAPGPGPGRFPQVARLADVQLAGELRIQAEEADLSPFVPSLSGSGTLDFRLAEGQLHVAGQGLELAALGFAAQDLELSVHLDRLSPPTTPAGQRLAVGALAAGLDVGGGELRFDLDPGGVLRIQSLDWRFHGGRLTSVARLDLAAERNELVVGVGQVDLASLVEALEREDLRASGRVGGELPLRIEGDRIFVDGGRLTATEEGGVIRYQSGRAPGSGGGGVSLVLDALENFHYRRLELGVDGELTGQMRLAIRLEGSNPAVYEGHPFQVDLNLEGPLAAVVKGSTTGFRIQDAVEERFQQQRRKERP